MNNTESTVKICSRCRESLPVAQFWRNARRADGLQNECKDCHRARPLSAETIAKGKVRAVKNRERCKKRARGYYRANPQPAIERGKKTYRAHKEEYIRKAVERHKANPIKRLVTDHRYLAKKHGCEGEFTEQEWIDVCESHNHLCAMCGEAKPLTVDHIIPLTKHGRNTIDNIQPLCLSCNTKKGNRVPSCA